MIKKFTRNVFICDLPRNFSEAVTKENLQTYQKIQIWNKACPDKVINVVQLLVQSDGEAYCCC